MLFEVIRLFYGLHFSHQCRLQFQYGLLYMLTWPILHWLQCKHTALDVTYSNGQLTSLSKAWSQLVKSALQKLHETIDMLQLIVEVSERVKKVTMAETR